MDNKRWVDNKRRYTEARKEREGRGMRMEEQKCYTALCLQCVSINVSKLLSRLSVVLYSFFIGRTKLSYNRIQISGIF